MKLTLGNQERLPGGLDLENLKYPINGLKYTAGSHIRMAYDRLAAQYPPKRDSRKGQRQEVMKTEVGPAE